MSFQLPSNTLSQADLDASNKSPVYVAVAVGFLLATAGVILRAAARRKSQATFAWDDYTIIFALVGTRSFSMRQTSLASSRRQSMDWVNIFPLSFPPWFHFKKSASSMQRSPHVETTDKDKVALLNITLWLATAAATKASLLLLYYRLFSPSKRFRFAVRVGAVIVFCQWISLTCATIFQCRPVAAFWNHTIRDAKCINLPRFTIVGGVLNLLTDVLILCLPIPMVWGLNTTKTQKVTLTGIFLLGVLVCAISIIRISKLASVNYDDPTWRLVDVYLWTALEISVGIFSACLPTMRPLFGRFLPGAPKAESSNKKDSRPNSQSTAKAQFNRLFDESVTEIRPIDDAKGGGGDAWTSPDLAASNELFSMAKAPTRPLHSMNPTRQGTDQQYPAKFTRRANYE
ncbi:MAG: hypothetical protein ALECFALPRED_010215 [Alectoria fallacina]|uniref:Rhodopsin domain-containing protein n=1 Tax=Alectoria fallacina TaxID=1903189 RepID=A0A8H3J9J8_9LECA|nr:MAG: hypothetical protein ALECFALPRED_010215 [Alectoria fallacina]